MLFSNFITIWLLSGCQAGHWKALVLTTVSVMINETSLPAFFKLEGKGRKKN